MSDQPASQRISDGIDAVLIRVLEQGLKVISGYNKDGTAIIETVDPPAAFVAQGIKRLQQLGISKVATPDNPVAQAVERAASRLRLVGGYPDVGEEPDAAAA